MRSEDLTRASNANRPDRPEVKYGELRPVKVKKADPKWHPIAKMIYESFRTSGQADYCQQSDWAYAWLLCDQISDFKTAAKPSAMMFAAIQSGLHSLLITEADRRRARIELSRPVKEDDTAGDAVRRYKRSLGVIDGAATG